MMLPTYIYIAGGLVAVVVAYWVGRRAGARRERELARVIDFTPHLRRHRR